MTLQKNVAETVTAVLVRAWQQLRGGKRDTKSHRTFAETRLRGVGLD